MYKTTDLRQLFGVSRQTISAWCSEFEAYLSPTATPSDGSHRQLTDDDLSVLALVSEMSRAGRPFVEIHAALGAGQRGELPDVSSSELVPLDANSQLALMRAKVLDMATRIDTLQTERDEAVGRAKELREQHDQLWAELKEAYRQMARLEAQAERRAND